MFNLANSALNFWDCGLILGVFVLIRGSVQIKKTQRSPNTDFLWPVFYRIRTEPTILSLYEKTRIKNLQHSGIFYAVYVKEMINNMLAYFFKRQTEVEVGYVSVELSFLIFNFLASVSGNFGLSKVSDPRKIKNELMI